MAKLLIVKLMCLSILMTLPGAPLYAQGLNDIKNALKQFKPRTAKEVVNKGSSGTAKLSSSSHNTILRVQRRLNQLGYNVGEPDGRSGARTRGGIRRFQFDNGFRPTGRLTEAHMQSLFAAKDANAPRARTADSANSNNGSVAPAAVQPVEAKGDTAYIASKYGIPAIDGHLVWPDEKYGRGKPLFGTLSAKKIRDRWSRFWTRNNYMSRRVTFEDTAAFAAHIMSNKEMRRIVKKYNKDSIPDYHVKSRKNFAYFLKRLDEFDRGDIQEMIKRRVASSEFGRVVKSPIKVLNIVRVGFGEYNRSSSELAVRYTSNSSRGGLKLLFPNLAVGHRIKNYNYPAKVKFIDRKWAKSISIPREMARSIVKRLQSNRYAYSQQREGYYGVFGELKLGSSHFEWTMTKVVFAYDPGLRSQVLPVTLDDVTIDFGQKRRAIAAAKADRAKQAAMATEAAAFENKRIAAKGARTSNMDILGIKLGYALEKGRAVSKKTLGAGAKPVRLSSPKPLGYGQQYYLGDLQRASKRMVLFTRPTKPSDDSIIAIAWVQRYKSSDVKPTQIVNSLMQKYGKPQARYKYHRSGVWLLWGDGDVARQQLKRDGTSAKCALYPLRNFYLGDGGKSFINSYELKAACGKVLSVFVDDDKLQMLLLDTPRVLEERKKLIDNTRRKKAKDDAKKAPSSIKF